MYDYIIVGAGLFGSVCAYELNKRGKKVLVIEKRNHIGGNVYTEKIDGIDVHKYGAHIFHTNNKKIWNYINTFGEFEPFINSPIAIYKNEVYNLPFNMNTFTKIWNIKTPHEAKEQIEKEIGNSKVDNPVNLEEQAINLVGKTIYTKLIKGYTEKQWGKKCNELPPEIIKRLPVRYTYDNNYFKDKYQGIPKEGYTKLIENMLNGIEVRLNCDYFEVLDSFRDLKYNYIYTGQIDKFFNYCYKALEYRSLTFENEIIDTENYQGNAVVNFTDYEIPYTRIIEHKHFLKQQSDKTIITKEYPCKWNKDIEPYYPINDEKNNSIYNLYKQLADKQDKVIFGGRLGSYQYYDMDKTIEKALELVEQLT